MRNIPKEGLPIMEQPVTDQDMRAVAVARQWRRILDLGLVLWVVRVPLASAVLGLVLLGWTPQAQDLFADNQGLLHSLLFFILLALVWAIPLHYSGRLLLNHDERLQHRKASKENGARNLDQFESYLARLRESWRDALARLGGFGPFRITARIILVPLRLVARLLYGLAKSLVALIAMPGLTANERHRFRKGEWTCLEYAEHVTPRLLGVSAFIAVIFGLLRAWLNLPESDNTDVLQAARESLRVFGIGALISFAVFFIYIVRRRGPATRFGRWVETRFRVPPGVVALLILWFFSVAIVVTGAAATAEVFGRVLAVPIILGGWLPFLTLLSHYGRKRSFPFIVASALLVAGLTIAIGDNHTVRRLRTLLPSAPYDEGALDLEVAVHLWKTANGCGQSQTKCPRPIIVAAAGGASRAGFYTAGALGHLIHQTSPKNLDAHLIRKRIFAISSVSGGSVGAAFMVAALKAAGSEGTPPCKDLGQRTGTSELWFGDRISNWRDCLEALLAGDFLTPIAIGGAYHDVLRFGWWDDRAALLERSWEDRFRQMTGRKADSAEECGLACPFLNFAPSHDFWLPLLVLNGTSVHTGRRIVTTPLHIEYRHPLRQDAVNMPKDPCPNGRAKTNSKGDRCRLFAETYRFHDLINDDAKPDRHLGWLSRNLAQMQRWFVADFWADFWSAPWPFYDVPLSTAAHNSARFPVISPTGAVRNREHQITDRIVDGGYFENYGAVSALELARAIRHIDGNLKPFAVVISNDPEVPVDLEAVISKERAQQLHKISGLLHIDATDAEFASGITGPIATVANTRTARGTLAFDQLRTELDSWSGNKPEPNVAHFRTIPQFYANNKVKAVSMSWWMSKPIQARLHQQIECEYNHGQLALILRALEVDEPEMRRDPCVLERLEKP